MNYTRACDCTAFQITYNLEEFRPNAIIYCIIHETDIIRYFTDNMFSILFIYFDVRIIYLEKDVICLLPNIKCNLITST